MLATIIELANPEKETNFENCLADVNIPLGEVFTSPKLTGTNGVLHVSQVYLNELKYNDLEITFENGCIKDYTCKNFDTEEENKKVEEGSLQIGYGSDKVEEEKTQFLMWQEGDLQYLIMDMGTEIPKDEFVNMAKQVIDMQ